MMYPPEIVYGAAAEIHFSGRENPHRRRGPDCPALMPVGLLPSDGADLGGSGWRITLRSSTLAF